MNKLHGVFAIALALVAATGCSRSDHSAPSSAAPPAASAAPAGGGESMNAGAPFAAGRALVVTMEMRITVANVPEARERVRAEVARARGYVADASSFGKGDVAQSVSMDLRVPASQVQGVRGTLERLGDTTSDVEKVQDVTEERADLDARLSNARASEKRVLEIMTTKAGGIHDVIEAEKEVSRIRESIERMEAQKRTLDGRIDLATIHLTLSATPAPAAWKTPGKSIATAAGDGVRAAQAGAVYGAIVFVSLAPSLLPIAALITGLVLLMRSRRRDEQRKHAAFVSG